MSDLNQLLASYIASIPKRPQPRPDAGALPADEPPETLREFDRAAPPDRVPPPKLPQEESNLRTLLRQYGPLAAAAAVAIPAILMRKGPGVEELLQQVRRIIPKHVEQVERSPFPFIMRTNPLKTIDTSMVNWQTPSREEGVPAFMNHPVWRMSHEDVLQGKRPTALAFIDIGTQPTEGVELLPTAVHEFGHAAGGARMIGKYPKNDPWAAISMGGTHQDLLDNPQTQQIIANEMRKNPHIIDYAVNRFQNSYEPTTLPDFGTSGTIAESLGEVLNEIWTQRMFRNAKVPFKQIEAQRWTPAHVTDRQRLTPVIDALARSGRLPEKWDAARRNFRDTFMYKLGDPPTNTWYPFLR